MFKAESVSGAGRGVGEALTVAVGAGVAGAVGEAAAGGAAAKADGTELRIGGPCEVR